MMFRKISRKIGKVVLPFFAILVLGVIFANFFAKNVEADINQSKLDSLKTMLSNGSNTYDTSNNSNNFCMFYKDGKWGNLAAVIQTGDMGIKGLKQEGGFLGFLSHPVPPSSLDECLALTAKNPDVDFVWMNNNGTANYYKPGTTTKTSTDLYKAKTVQPSDTGKFTESQCNQLGTGEAVDTYVWSKGDEDVSKKNGKGIWKNGSCDVSAMDSSAIKISCDNFGISDSDCKKYLKTTAETECKLKWFDFNIDAATVSKDEASKGFDGTSGCYTPCPSNKDEPLIADDCSQKSGADTSTKCALTNGLGFIICPIMWLVSKTIDTIYNLLLQNLFLIPVDMFTNAGVTGAFGNFLVYANLLLAIVFLLIIYSEATGNGFGAMGNYNIKKTLPRLIIFAVLINISFYICAAAVDVSNIAGSGMYELFAGKNHSLTTSFEKQTDKATGTADWGQ